MSIIASLCQRNDIRNVKVTKLLTLCKPHLDYMIRSENDANVDTSIIVDNAPAENNALFLQPLRLPSRDACANCIVGIAVAAAEPSRRCGCGAEPLPSRVCELDLGPPRMDSLLRSEDNVILRPTDRRIDSSH